MEIGKELEALGLYLRRQREDYMASFGIKSSHTRILLEIGDEPGISQDRLAVKMELDKSNVARQVAFLEEEGFVFRTPAPDNRRMLQLRLTDKAHAMLPRLQKARDNWEQRLLQDLSHWEVSQLSAMLERIRRATQEES